MSTVSKRTWEYNGKPRTSWVLRYVDAEGKRRLKTFETKTDANRARLEIETQIDLEKSGDRPKERSIVHLCDDFLKVLDARRKEKSISYGRYLHFRIVFDRYLLPALGNKAISKVALVDVENLYTAMVRGRLSSQTARHYIGACITLERFAKKRGFTKSDIFADFMSERPKGERERIRTFTVDETRALLSTAAIRPPLYRHRAHAFLNCVVNLAAFCGLRRGEIFGLIAKNIDFVEGFIRVRHNLDRTDTLKGPKTRAGIRDVPMPSHVAEMLAAWMRDHAVTDPRGLIFRTIEGYRFGGGNFNERWQDLLKRSGFDKKDEAGRSFHFHALRHFAASYMIECGWSLPEVAALLGHSTFDMTLQTYAHAVAGGRQRSDRMQAMATRLLTLDSGHLTLAPLSTQQIAPSTLLNS